ncbi:MAG: HAD family hydrolase [Candidatus Aenigmarchaeota archaeon]|nr:HAD family hydrolase [Candidatus Aenigmarchaeota archaeon]
MKQKSLIFDADNTLYKVNAKTAYEKQFSFICDSFGFDRIAFKEEWKKIIKTVEFSTSLIKRSREYSFTRAINIALEKKKHHVEKNIIEDVVEKSLELFYEELLKTGIEFDKKIPPMILKLKKRYNLFVASDEYRKPLLKKLSFMFGNSDDYFDDIVSCQEAGCLKPSKKFYEYLIKKYKFDAKSMTMIGDDWRRDLEPAKQMGIVTVLVNAKKEGCPDIWMNEINQLMPDEL